MNMFVKIIEDLATPTRCFEDKADYTHRVGAHHRMESLQIYAQLLPNKSADSPDDYTQSVVQTLFSNCVLNHKRRGITGSQCLVDTKIGYLHIR